MSDEHTEQILAIANEEAEAYMGMPAIYAVCEAIRTWLADNNVKGLDDVSMHAQMIRKQKEAEQNKVGLYSLVIYICLSSILVRKHIQADSTLLHTLDLYHLEKPFRVCTHLQYYLHGQ